MFLDDKYQVNCNHRDEMYLLKLKPLPFGKSFFMNHSPSSFVYPGEILLRKFLDPMGLTQKKFALHLNWTYARLNEIINMKRSVTADSALAFSEALGTTPEYWLDLQRDWDLQLARKQHTPVKRLSK